MWFVLEVGTERTVAMTDYKDIAMMIAKTMPTECMVRYAGGIKCEHSDNKIFFKESSEMSA